MAWPPSAADILPQTVVDLYEVTIPLLVFTAEQDSLCAPKWVESVLAAVPNQGQVSFVTVPGAGHFSLQTPYPPELAHIPPAHDPPGFDRAGYQPAFYASVAEFLCRELAR
jgi:pimeloyl-ACP methyl ester carboxylesterase